MFCTLSTTIACGPDKAGLLLPEQGSRGDAFQSCAWTTGYGGYNNVFKKWTNTNKEAKQHEELAQEVQQGIAKVRSVIAAAYGKPRCPIQAPAESHRSPRRKTSLRKTSIHAFTHVASHEYKHCMTQNCSAQFGSGRASAQDFSCLTKGQWFAPSFPNFSPLSAAQADRKTVLF